MSLFNVKNHMN